MSTAIACPVCGRRDFHSNYVPAKAATQFLWIRRPAEPARLILECLRCRWTKSYEPGSIRAANGANPMRALEFDVV